MRDHDLVIRNGTVVDGTGAPPKIADLAINGETITQVGDVSGKGFCDIDAEGKIVAPGWVDIHTHYDGQATWDPYLTPSSWHGVTTVVMGNCGVGFAPAKTDKHDWLIGLMEGVEDIPGAALAEGITWEWESFPEYLNALEKMPRAIDVGAQVPHGAVRAYVMEERGAKNEAAKKDDIEAMAEIVREGIEAGALGFSTSRTMLHLSKDGEPVPGTFANHDELIGLGRALAKAGHGVFEMASDLTPEQDEFTWMKALSKETGLPVSYALLQSPIAPDSWRKLLKQTEEAVREGANIKAQVAVRPAGLILGWQSTAHPFGIHPTYMEIADLPFQERLKKLKDPKIRAKILAEEPDYSLARSTSGNGESSELSTQAGLLHILTKGFGMMFRLRTEEGALDYEPRKEDSIGALAKAKGVNPYQILYDAFMENDGTGYIYLPLLNYAEQNLDHLYEMVRHPNTVLSLSDGGAHCGVICDASYPTFLLTHWVRDRSRGARLSLEEAVRLQTSETADFYGLRDRGRLAAGMKADVNVIDLEALRIAAPEMVYDLPAGGRRLIQKAEGYCWTVKSGAVIYENGKATGALPGRLIRGPQAAPVMKAAAE